jgi:hypothetical protein
LKLFHIKNDTIASAVEVKAAGCHYSLRKLLCILMNQKTFLNLRYDKEIEESSLALSYIDHNAKLEAGVDFSAMCSIVTAQPEETTCIASKSSTPWFLRMKSNWVKIFGFYKHHKNKELDMY